jgi:hypothetical protein
MSFPKKGKSFPKKGGDGGSDFSLDDHAFAMKIASALTSELKDRNSRAKLVAGWTGANERTVKNWISGRYAPCGRHLTFAVRSSGLPIGWPPGAAGCGAGTAFSGLTGGVGCAGPLFQRNLIRLGPLHYSWLRGEGSIPVPLPPPTLSGPPLSPLAG